MRRRVWWWVTVALVLLLCATFGTARATQVVDRNAAYGTFTAARTVAVHALASASTDGMRSKALSPFQARAAQLARRPAPPSTPLWDTASAAYYRALAADYRVLARQVKAADKLQRIRSRHAATGALTTLGRLITIAARLDLDTSEAVNVQKAQQSALSSSTSTRSSRAVRTAVRAEVLKLSSVVEARKAAFSSVLSKSGGTLAGVQTLADTEANEAQSRLSLLSLLTTRSSAYSSTVTGLVSAIHDQTTVAGAVDRELALEDELQRIDADYDRTIPAKMIVVSTENQTATMYEKSTAVYSTVVTTGGPELPTDHGVFHIYFKASPFVFHSPWPIGSPYYYDPTPVQFWMPFDGGEGPA